MSNENTVPASDDKAVLDMERSGVSQGMSISIVIGCTIGVMGLIILLTGVVGHPDLTRSDNINIDLWWGILMVVFGIIMAGGSYLSNRLKHR